MHYTYIHTRNDTNEVFYVGKGSTTRAWSDANRNQWWHRIVKKHGYSVQICANWKTAAEAYDHEDLLVNCFVDMGYKLVNINHTKGGYAGTVRKTRSDKGVLRPHKVKPKIEPAVKYTWPLGGTNHPMYGKSNSGASEKMKGRPWPRMSCIKCRMVIGSNNLTQHQRGPKCL